jgi:hypothetical protein
MEQSTDQNLKRRQLLRQTIEALAGPLEGEARQRFIDGAEAILNRNNPPASAASKRKAFRIV